MVLALAAPAFAINQEGTRADETLVGTEDRDNLRGKGGNDRLEGLGGKDKLFGGTGNDTLVGGTGEDYLEGGPGDDVIYTGTETEGDKQADEYSCGDGYDIVYVSGKDHSTHTNTSGAPQDNTCEEIRRY